MSRIDSIHLFRLMLSLALIFVSNPLLPNKLIEPKTFLVNTLVDQDDSNLSDDICSTELGECSLRAAIQQANYDPDLDTVIIPAGIYALSKGQLFVMSSMVIQGAGSQATILDAVNADRIMRIDKSGVTNGIDVIIVGLTLTNGNITGEGGAVWNDENVAFGDVKVMNNRATLAGGGFYNYNGLMSIYYSIIRENTVTAAAYLKGGGGIYSEYGNITISDSSVISNTVPSGSGSLAYGGGLFARYNPVNIYRSTFRGNEVIVSIKDHGTGGAAIYLLDRAPLVMEDSLIEKNKGTILVGYEGVLGIAILTQESDITLRRTIIRDNVSDFLVAGIVFGGGNFIMESSAILNNHVSGGIAGLSITTNRGFGKIINSTISGNISDSGTESGVRFYGGAVEIINSTISGNQATEATPWSGYDLKVDVATTVTMTHSTISNTVGSPSIFIGGSTAKFVVKNSILAGECNGNIISLGHNLLPSMNQCTYTPATGDITGQDAALTMLADNGEGIFTHALLPGSPAINHGTCTDPTGHFMHQDQRGMPRFSPCDIGAYELFNPEDFFPVYLPITVR